MQKFEIAHRYLPDCRSSDWALLVPFCTHLICCMPGFPCGCPASSCGSIALLAFLLDAATMPTIMSPLVSLEKRSQLLLFFLYGGGQHRQNQACHCCAIVNRGGVLFMLSGMEQGLRPEKRRDRKCSLHWVSAQRRDALQACNKAMQRSSRTDRVEFKASKTRSYRRSLEAMQGNTNGMTIQQ